MTSICRFKLTTEESVECAEIHITLLLEITKLGANMLWESLQGKEVLMSFLLDLNQIVLNSLQKLSTRSTN